MHFGLNPLILNSLDHESFNTFEYSLRRLTLLFHIASTVVWELPKLQLHNPKHNDEVPLLTIEGYSHSTWISCISKPCNSSRSPRLLWEKVIYQDFSKGFVVFESLLSKSKLKVSNDIFCFKIWKVSILRYLQVPLPLN